MITQGRPSVTRQAIACLEHTMSSDTGLYPTYFRVDSEPIPGRFGLRSYRWVIGFAVEACGGSERVPAHRQIRSFEDRLSRYQNIAGEILEWDRSGSDIWPLEEVRELAVD